MKSLRHVAQLAVIAFTVILAVAPATLAADGDDRAESNAAEAAASQPSSEETAEDKPGDVTLDTRQATLARRYKRFEEMMYKMYEYMQKTDPDRADLLLRAFKQSREAGIKAQMDAITNLLKRNSLGDAVSRQDELSVQLRALLKLLQSENRRDEIEAEKKRIKDLLKDLGRLIGKEKDVRAATERGEDADRLTGKQERVADDTQRLVDKIDRQDAEKSGGQTGRRSQGDKSGSKGQKKDGDSQDPDKKKGGDDDSNQDDKEKKDAGDDSQNKDADSKKSDGGGKKDGGKGKKGGAEKKGSGQKQNGQQNQNKQGQQNQGQQNPQQNSQQQNQQSQDSNRTPGREEIEKARQDMERAIEELKKQKHDDASGHQDEAIRRLEEAKAKLEEILRQLREEERELVLAALEARFQKMLAMQLMVYNGTVNLDKVKEKQPRHFSRSQELAKQEREIAVDADKALELLKAEGSSVAFPEAVIQLRDDIVTVAIRLDDVKVGELTQGIERDIIEALEEMIEAVQREMEKSDEERRQQQGQPGPPQDPQLVDQLAELKMLRSLQLRVNRRTRRLSRLIEDGNQAAEEDVLAQLRELSRRQARIQEATYNLATGRNR